MEVLRPGQPAPVSVWFSSALATRLPEHHHEVLELNLVLAGWLVYAVEGQLVRIDVGQCIFFPAGVRHELQSASEDLALWVIEFDAELDLATQGAQRAGAAWLASPSEAWLGRTGRVARRLWLRPDVEEAERARAELLTALAAPFGRARRSAKAPVHPAVLKARRICEQRSAEPLAIDELGREAGLSSSRLSHLFQEQVGITPLQYRNVSRIQNFVRRWDGQLGTLLEVALASGFGSYAQFHRVFCQVCGEAPRAHMKWLASAAIDRALALGEPLVEPLPLQSAS